MRLRVRAAVLVVREDHILLVKHVRPATGESWWVPPGGGLEDGDASILDCARRETLEETGLEVEPGRLVYLREFQEDALDTRHLELFFLGGTPPGEPKTVAAPNVGGDLIEEVAWMSRRRLTDPMVTVYPDELRDIFWLDREAGFPSVRFLGVQRDSTVGDAARIPREA